ncbi:hypothetical protein GCM10010334_59040 [Streptomyces finlayi]|uniref:Uncharacterized protein n=1 Tax=Streptomyces finlayi TaxID=67296 RepID=A0A918X316_9ACTN|nr:hypothetical protein [Streptomyces finlayi]GHD06986.1 hypothetical protein GCM10010334_59040 [Streptomyces finlayi]
MSEGWDDLWPVVAEVEREQWGYVPFERVGPLRFGMREPEALAVMAAAGFACEAEVQRGHIKGKVTFRKSAERGGEPDVTAYFVDHLDAEGLTCVTVDGRGGPQVTWEGIKLIGRVPSQLTAEFLDYVEARDLGFGFSVQGDVFPVDQGFIPATQRAGDVLVTRAMFANPEGWAFTVDDCIPQEAWGVR